MSCLLINIIIRILGRSLYSGDIPISSINRFLFFISNFFELIRGLYTKIQFIKTKVLVVLSKRTTLKHCNLISAGRNIFMVDTGLINALSQNGVEFGNEV